MNLLNIGSKITDLLDMTIINFIFKQEKLNNVMDCIVLYINHLFVMFGSSSNSFFCVFIGFILVALTCFDIY